MPTGTHADPFILNAAPGAHNLALTWHDEDLFGGVGGPVTGYTVAYADPFFTGDGGGRHGQGQVNNSAFHYIQALAAPYQDDVITVGMAVNGGGYNADTDGDDNGFLSFWGDGNTVCHIFFDVGSNTLVAKRGRFGTTLGIASAAIPLSTWNYITIQVKLHDTAGYVKVRQNSTMVLNLTNIDTKNGGTGSVIDGVRIGGSWPANFNIDDLYIANGETPSLPNDPGDVQGLSGGDPLPDGNTYPVAFAKVTAGFDRGSLKITANPAWGRVAVQTFYERVDGYPDWEGNGWNSWNIGDTASPTFPFWEQLYNGLDLWLAFVDWNRDSSLPDAGPMTVTYTVGSDLPATPLPSTPVANRATYGTPVNLTNPPTMSNLFSTTMAISATKAIVVYGGLDDVYADLVDTSTNPPTILDHELVGTSSFANWYAYPLGAEMIVGQQIFSPASNVWRSVTSDGTSVTVTTLGSRPTAFSETSGSPSGGNWYPLNNTGLGVYYNSTGLKVIQTGAGGSLVSAGTAWTEPAGFNFQGVHPVPGNPAALWITLLDEATGFSPYGLVHAAVSGATITSDSPVFSDLPTPETTPLECASNWPLIKPISAEYAVGLYTAYDAVNGVQDGELGEWIDIFRFTGGTISRIGRNQAEPVVKHYDVNDSFQDLYYVTDYSGYFEAFVLDSVMYLHGVTNAYFFSGAFGGTDSVDTAKQLSLTVGPSGATSSSLVAQPGGMVATTSVHEATLVGANILFIYHDRGTDHLRAGVFTPAGVVVDPPPDPDPDPTPDPDPEPTMLPASPGCEAGDVQIVPSNPAYATVYLNVTETDGTKWLLADAEGWWTLPPPNLLDIPRPQKQDGSYDVEGNYLARLVTITGRFLPGASSMVPAKRAQLLRACDSMRGSPAQLIFNESPPKMAYARLIDQPRVATEKTSGETSFELPFKCIDPRKYSLVESVGSVGTYTSAGYGREYDRSYPMDYLDVVPTPENTSEITAVNAGSVATPPLIVLTGPMADPEILNFTTGQSLEFPGLIINDGETMIIDVAEHTAIIGEGQRVSYLAYDSVWWSLVPGTNIVRLIANDGYGGPSAGSMTFSWRSAWME